MDIQVNFNNIFCTTRWPVDKKTIQSTSPEITKKASEQSKKSKKQWRERELTVLPASKLINSVKFEVSQFPDVLLHY